ncbi:ABC transporter substrate-binding protein [Nocardia brevicatena]|uniref:ABC transporter substrate-binding protein n=1 Tax=Nocardia brevicatena TaxID=37327 RepID=UPI0002E07E4A|nr:ABC transporter substrate-binding protein [Nocardia brevicatena]
MRTRRTVLQAVALAPLAAACAPDVLLGSPDAVRIAVSWSGFELAAFRSLAAVPMLPCPVEVVPLGDDIGTAFTAGGRSAPDIVMLPQAGRVRDLAERGRLRPLPKSLWDDAQGPRYVEQWRRLCWYRDTPYAVPFKAAAKSLVWYDRESLPEHRLSDPRDWTLSDWGDRMRGLIDAPRKLLALGAADGWVLTDLFENLLLAESPAVYETMGTAGAERVWDQPAVRAAFGHLGGLWGRRAAPAGGIGPALTRQFPDAVREVFEHRRAAVVVAPDFAEPVVRGALRRARRREDVVGVAEFPAAGPGGYRPRIVGGDVMVVTASANPRADAVVTALATPQAPVPWIERTGGFLGPNLRTVACYSAWLAPTAERLPSWPIFDLSDRIGEVGGRDGLWRVLTDFLIAVGDSGDDIGAATARAVAALDRFERRRR